MRREAMIYVWCEWICSKCKQLHRAKFEVRGDVRNAKKVKGILLRENCYIYDGKTSAKFRGTKSPTRHESRIYVEWDTDISEIFSVLESYMLEYCAIQEGSLKMDVCREGSYRDSSPD
jgi:hypothetical protein